MSDKRYTEEIKIEAVKQVTKCGHPRTDVAARLGVSSHSLPSGSSASAPPWDVGESPLCARAVGPHELSARLGTPSTAAAGR